MFQSGANEMPFVSGLAVQQPAVTFTDDEQIYRCASKHTEQFRHEKASIHHLLDLLVIQDVCSDVIQDKLDLLVPKSPDRGLPEVELAQSSLTDADLKPCHTMVLCFTDALVELS